MLEPMIEFAREELEHFHIMYKIVAARGLKLIDDYRDAYVNGLRRHVRPNGDELLLDRLMVAGIVEARGCERLHLVAEALPDADPSSSACISISRARNRATTACFSGLHASTSANNGSGERASQLLDVEAELVERLPHRAAVH